MRPLKKKIHELLERRDFLSIRQLTASDHKIISALISSSYDKKNRLSWLAIEAIGVLSKEIGIRNPDSLRNTIGRLLWMIRDESGGIGWSAPEILGEIVRNNPDTCSDVAPIIASFHEEKMLTGSVLRAMGRAGKINAETIDYAVPIAVSYLDSDDPVIRGHAAYALGELGTQEQADLLVHLMSDEHRIDFYEDGELNEITVGGIASRSRDKLMNS